mgnify:FL=1
MDIKDVYGLKAAYQERHPEGHFFDDETLKFFGERLSEMRLLRNQVEVTDLSGEIHKCYVLSSMQRNAPCGPERAYHYFDVDTIDSIFVRRG